VYRRSRAEETCPEILAEIVSVAQLLRLEGQRTRQFNDPRTRTERLPNRLAHRQRSPRERPCTRACPAAFRGPPPPLCGPYLLDIPPTAVKKHLWHEADKTASHAYNLPAGGAAGRDCFGKAVLHVTCTDGDDSRRIESVAMGGSLQPHAWVS
jgi:hypothetical protein